MRCASGNSESRANCARRMLSTVRACADASLAPVVSRASAASAADSSAAPRACCTASPPRLKIGIGTATPRMRFVDPPPHSRPMTRPGMGMRAIFAARRRASAATESASAARTKGNASSVVSARRALIAAERPSSSAPVGFGGTGRSHATARASSACMSAAFSRDRAASSLARDASSAIRTRSRSEMSPAVARRVANRASESAMVLCSAASALWWSG